MIQEMPQVRMSDAEIARNFAAVLQQVRQGVEVVIEQDARPVAVLRMLPGLGRHIDECIALAKVYEKRLGCAPFPDPGFAEDVQSAIAVHREPLEPPKWD